MNKVAVFGCLLAALTGVVKAEPTVNSSRTDGQTLNDLVRRLPILSRSRERELRRLSSVQEQLLVFECEMRGEGLPQPLGAAFSYHYSAVVNAMLGDHISGEQGREILADHRELLDRAHQWNLRRVRDENFPKSAIRELYRSILEVDAIATPGDGLNRSLRTPVVNGYQVWLGELVAWGCDCNHFSQGVRDRLLIRLERLERFETSYKRDGRLTQNEREQLHERLLNLTRETMELIAG